MYSEEQVDKFVEASKEMRGIVDDYMEWYISSHKTIFFDGCFTSEQLRKVADLMDKITKELQ